MPEKQYFEGIDIVSGGTVISSADVADTEARASLEELEDYVESITPVALSVTENGTYTAPTGVFGYSPVTVAVSKDFYPKAHATLDDASRVEGDDMRVYPMGGTDYYPYVYLGAMPYPAQQGDDFEPCGKYFAGQTQEHTVTTFLDLIDVATGESVSGYPQRVAPNWSVSIVDGGYMRIVSWTVKASGAVSVTTERYNPTYTKPLQDTKDSTAVTGGKLDDYVDASYYIDGGAGESVLLQSLTATANGTYTAPARTAYNEVTVNVPAPAIVTKHIRGNGIFSAADDNVAGYSDVIVDASPNDAFFLIVTLDNPNKLTVSFEGNEGVRGEHNFLVMWGDGTEVQKPNFNSRVSHTYQSIGTYGVVLYPIDDALKPAVGGTNGYTFLMYGNTYNYVPCEYCKLPDNVVAIIEASSYIYSGQSFKSVSVPAGLTAMKAGTFAYNDNLEGVYMKPTTPPTMEDTSEYGLPFVGCPNLEVIYVPTEAVSAYKAASGWSTYADIIQPMPL